MVSMRLTKVFIHKFRDLPVNSTWEFALERNRLDCENEMVKESWGALLTMILSMDFSREGDFHLEYQLRYGEQLWSFDVSVVWVELTENSYRYAVPAWNVHIAQQEPPACFRLSIAQDSGSYPGILSSRLSWNENEYCLEVPNFVGNLREYLWKHMLVLMEREPDISCSFLQSWARVWNAICFTSHEKSMATYLDAERRFNLKQSGATSYPVLFFPETFLKTVLENTKKRKNERIRKLQWQSDDIDWLRQIQDSLGFQRTVAELELVKSTTNTETKEKTLEYKPLKIIGFDQDGQSIPFAKWPEPEQQLLYGIYYCACNLDILILDDGFWVWPDNLASSLIKGFVGRQVFILTCIQERRNQLKLLLEI
jgi:hypothetical protein